MPTLFHEALLLLLLIGACLGAGFCLSRAFPPATVALPSFGLDDIQLARIAHEANRAYCLTIGDFSQRAWQNAEEWQRESAINGVRYLRMNPDATPEQMHENWMAEKIAQGWRYGPTKCARARTHPCIAPYGELPEAQRFKDHLFSAIVKLGVIRPV